jgi:UDP-2,3-diacylglucosamine hydrolase
MAQRLSILAGNGQLAMDAIKAALANGWTVQVLALTQRSDLEIFSPITVSVAKPLGTVMKLRAFKPSHICMVGGIDISDSDREGLFGFLRKKPGRPKSSGDTGLSSLVTALEFTTGAKVIGVHNLLPDLLAQIGLIAGPALNRQQIEDCVFAIEVARSIGSLDIGQAVVCSGQRILGVEDIAGTDALITRIGTYVSANLAGNGTCPLVLAKAKKPNQPDLVDLPAIGPDTIDAAKKAGIGIIAVQTGATLLVSKGALVERASEHGISVFGIEVV